MSRSSSEPERALARVPEQALGQGPAPRGLALELAESRRRSQGVQ